ncbi:MAG: hypothetical protein KatS3mg054_0107 [Chloroflexus sp.]|nr:MAG: hypothetical protein KatS3mg054_0107 [Chloroflexus sp.]
MVEVDRKTLLWAASRCASVSSKDPRKITPYIKIACSGGGLWVEGASSVEWLRVEVGNTDGKWQVIVPAKPIVDILRTKSQDKVALSCVSKGKQAGQLQVFCDGAELSVKSLEGDVFPSSESLDSVVSDGAHISVELGELARVLSGGSLGALAGGSGGKYPEGHFYYSVLIEVIRGAIRAVSSDGKRISVIESGGQNGIALMQRVAGESEGKVEPEVEAMISTESARELADLATDAVRRSISGPARLIVTKRGIRCSIGKIVYQTATVNASPVNYRSVVAHHSLQVNETVSAPAGVLRGAINRAHSVAKGLWGEYKEPLGGHTIGMLVERESITVATLEESSTGAKGRFIERVAPVNGPDTPSAVFFMPDLLQDALEFVGEYTNVDISYMTTAENGGVRLVNDTAVIVTTKSENFFYMFMPKTGFSDGYNLAEIFNVGR